MASITIRNVPEATRNELAARAARSGRSMQEYLRLELIGLASRPDPAEVAERVALRKERTGTRIGPEAILDALHADRR